MMKIVTSQEMRHIDNYTISNIGIPSMVLMERAALSVSNHIKELISNNKKIIIICGTGNNGGDGLALARILYSCNIRTKVIILGEEQKLSKDCKNQLDILKNIRIPFRFINNDYKLSFINEYDIIIDGIFGTGLTREISGLHYECIQLINNTNKYVISLDIPSGINASTGQVLGVAVKANITITFGLAKLGCLIYPGASYVGQLKITDIGFPQKAYNQIKSNIFSLEHIDLKFLPKRMEQSNKGTYGNVLVIAGSINMAGAAYLSAYAAYRIGAGVVKILTHENNRQILQTSLKEAILVTYNTSDEKELNQDEQSQIIKNIQLADSIVIGPGLSQSKVAKQLLKITLKYSNVPIIIDADALNILSQNISMLSNHKQQIILTPHPLEMARLKKTTVADITHNLVEHAYEICLSLDVICVLKDANTVITNSKKDICINQSGNNGMSTAGCGDVLTGIIAGLIAQKMKAYESACLGAYIHGLAGDNAKQKIGTYALMASDIINNLSYVINDEKTCN